MEDVRLFGAFCVVISRSIRDGRDLLQRWLVYSALWIGTKLQHTHEPEKIHDGSYRNASALQG
jgi:hypothetical protein